jgi:hypothetical protein
MWKDVSLRKELALTRSSAVYEVVVSKQGVRAVKFSASDPSSTATRKEFALAQWAHGRGLGPKVYELRSKTCSTGCGDVHMQAIFMEKMDGTLSHAKSAPFTHARQQWSRTFQLLASADLSVTPGDIFTQSGWLCGDDLKPDNILLRNTPGGTQTVFADWDALHWHVLPLPPASGGLVNFVMFCANCIALALNHCADAYTLVWMIGLWPEDATVRCGGVVALASQRDKVFMRFACTLDGILAKGPYHYAGVSGESRQTRAEAFAQFLAGEAVLCAFKDALSHGLAIRARLRSVLSDLRGATTHGKRRLRQ